MGEREPLHAANQIRGGREYQEDSFGVLTAESLQPSAGIKQVLILADGMGGHAGGNSASSLVVDTFKRSFSETTGPTIDRLRECLEWANDAVADAVDDSPELSGMGTTLVAAVISDKGLDWISIGDSLLWLYRNDSLKRLNADHSMAPVFEHLVQSGEMSEEDASTDRRRHALRSAVCGDDIALVDVSSQPVELQRDDVIVLASDGIDSLDPETLAQSLADPWKRSLDKPVSEILERVRLAGKANQDNTTLMLCAPCGLTTENSRVHEETTSPPSDHKRRRSSWWSRRPWAVASGVLCLAILIVLVVVLPELAGAQSHSLLPTMPSIIVNR